MRNEVPSSGEFNEDALNPSIFYIFYGSVEGKN
jgi:hypothetical protein